MPHSASSAITDVAGIEVGHFTDLRGGRPAAPSSSPGLARSRAWMGVVRRCLDFDEARRVSRTRLRRKSRARAMSAGVNKRDVDAGTVVDIARCIRKSQ